MTSPQLGYRPCVGIMVLNQAGEVWIGRRLDAPANLEGPGAWWQMPQGGIDESEDPAKAALRELYEETGVRSVPHHRREPAWYTYDFPPGVRHSGGAIAASGKSGSRCASWAATARWSWSRRVIRPSSTPGAGPGSTSCSTWCRPSSAMSTAKSSASSRR